MLHTSFRSGESPIVLSVPHDGRIVFPGHKVLKHVAKWRADGNSGRDDATREIASMIATILESRGLLISYVMFDLDRGHADPNRRPGNGSWARGFEESYNTYYAILAELVRSAIRRHGYAFLLDLHGFANQPGPEALALEMVIGTNGGQTTRGHLDKLFVTPLKKYRIAYSPDRALGVRPILQGGHIIRSVTERFKKADGLQLELEKSLRDATRQHAVAKDIASALENVVLAMSIGRVKRAS